MGSPNKLQKLEDALWERGERGETGETKETGDIYGSLVIGEHPTVGSLLLNLIV